MTYHRMRGERRQLGRELRNQTNRGLLFIWFLLIIKVASYKIKDFNSLQRFLIVTKFIKLNKNIFLSYITYKDAQLKSEGKKESASCLVSQLSAELSGFLVMCQKMTKKCVFCLFHALESPQLFSVTLNHQKPNLFLKVINQGVRECSEGKYLSNVEKA